MAFTNTCQGHGALGVWGMWLSSWTAFGSFISHDQDTSIAGAKAFDCSLPKGDATSTASHPSGQANLRAGYPNMLAQRV